MTRSILISIHHAVVHVILSSLETQSDV